MKRWMTLGYDRIKNQGLNAEVPPEHEHLKNRRAYGRNGFGRHGMLCFSDKYTVETSCNGQGNRFKVSSASGKEPFKLIDKEEFQSNKHGTKLKVNVEKNLPEAAKIREVLAARFLCDPEFRVTINGISIPLEDHKGIINSETLIVNDNIKLVAFFVDSSKAAKTARQHGVIFWVGKKSVGEPSWCIDNNIIIDGRRSLAKRNTVVIRTEDLYDEVLPDWTGFRHSQVMQQVYKSVSEYVNRIIFNLSAEKNKDTKNNILSEYHDDFVKLSRYEQRGVENFVDEIVYEQPYVNEDFLSSAVKAVINLEKSRSGAALLQKLSELSQEDIDGLNRLLDDWTISDAMAALGEIDRRITVIEALSRFSSDPNVDELKTLHPLVTQARCKFGPEFDSPCFTSNRSLVNAATKVFGKKAQQSEFINPKKRPDIVVLANSTVSLVGTEEFNTEGSLCKFRNILVIELKKGGFTIGRTEMNQAEGYVEDLLQCGHLDGTPYVHAFVVGHEINPKVTSVKKIGESPEFGRVEVCTFDQLVRTAEARLFDLKKQLKERYDDMGNDDVLQRVLF